MVMQVSSELKGNTNYFKRLSALIDDDHSRHKLYKHLMQLDISCVDWIRDRPVTEHMLQMVSMNLSYEHQFIKHFVQKKHNEVRKARPGSPV